MDGDRPLRRPGTGDLPAAAGRRRRRRGGCAPRRPRCSGRLPDARPPARDVAVDRRGFVGDHGRGDRRRATPTTTLWAAPGRAGRRASTAGTRTPTTSPGIALPAGPRAPPPSSRSRATGADVVVLGVPSHGLRGRARRGGGRASTRPTPGHQPVEGRRAGHPAAHDRGDRRRAAPITTPTASACSPARTSPGRSPRASRPRRSSRWATDATAPSELQQLFMTASEAKPEIHGLR